MKNYWDLFLIILSIVIELFILFCLFKSNLFYVLWWYENSFTYFNPHHGYICKFGRKCITISSGFPWKSWYWNPWITFFPLVLQYSTPIDYFLRCQSSRKLSLSWSSYGIAGIGTLSSLSLWNFNGSCITTSMALDRKTEMIIKKAILHGSYIVGYILWITLLLSRPRNQRVR